MIDPYIQMSEFIEFAKRATEREELQSDFQSRIGMYGYHMHTCLSTVDLSNRPFNSLFWIDYFDLDWAAHYVEQQYENSDPVLLRSIGSSTPYFWARDLDFGSFNKLQKRIFDEASDVDIVNGFTVPLIALGMPPTTVNIIGGQDVHSTPDQLNAFHLMAIFFHSAALRIESKNFECKPVKLTAREQECLQWVFAGKSSSVIAELLNVSQPTVDFHVSNAAKKFGVATRHQAAIHAFLTGQITF